MQMDELDDDDFERDQEEIGDQESIDRQRMRMNSQDIYDDSLQYNTEQNSPSKSFSTILRKQKQ